MATLVYWIAVCKDDRPAYSIRARTRKECMALRERTGSDHEKRYTRPVKVTVVYKDAFDLVQNLLGEGGESMYYRTPDDLYESASSGEED